MRTWMKTLASLSLGMLTSMSHANADDPNGNKSQGDIVVLPALDHGKLHLPGLEYKAGSGWWLLSCDKTCSLKAETLSSVARLHAQYDGPPVSGQVLSVAPGAAQHMVMLFKPFRGRGKQLMLAEGPVKTWVGGEHHDMSMQPVGHNMWAGNLRLSDGQVLKLIPRATDVNGPSQAGTGQADAETSNAGIPRSVALDVELNGSRQTIGDFMFGISPNETLKPSDYVVWIGDLDHDGKPDMLIQLSQDGAGTTYVLLLSSFAKPGQVVGEAGRFTYFPIESAGC